LYGVLGGGYYLVGFGFGETERWGEANDVTLRHSTGNNALAGHVIGNLVTDFLLSSIELAIIAIGH
jgi:hypothetical protein